MTQITVKTLYYYELLAEMKGRGKRPVPIHRGFEAQSISTEEIPKVFHPTEPNFKKLKKLRRSISNVLQNLLRTFVKRVRVSFPLARLYFKSGTLAGREYYVYNTNPPTNPVGYIKIGRENPHKEKFFIVLPHMTVSRTHVKIVFFNENLFIVNYSRVNPAEIDGQKIPINRSVQLPEGAIVSIGGIELVVEKIK